MSNTCLYEVSSRLTGRVFEPTALCGSPWSRDAQHGGPPCALLAFGIEEALGKTELKPARLAVDLFRAVPTGPLRLDAEIVRKGRRLAVVDARLVSPPQGTSSSSDSDGTPDSADRPITFARASALFLCGESRQRGDHASWPLPGPATDLGPMLPADSVSGFPPGFHSAVQVETLQADLQATWIRLPFELLPGVSLTPFQRAAATSDFCNALRGRSAADPATPFINTDALTQFARTPSGNWLGLNLLSAETGSHTGKTRCELFDEFGVFAFVDQNSLAAPQSQEPGRGPATPSR